MFLHFIFLVFFSTHSHPRSLPRFEDFAVDSKQIDTGLSIGIHFPDPSFGNEHRVYKEKERHKSDFAGHYMITGGYIRCGTGCIDIAIVNARNGKIYEVPFGIEGMLGAKMVADPRVEYQLNSNLLIIRGARNEKGCGTYFYKWTKNKLKLIRAIEDEIIPVTSSISTRLR